MLDHITSETCRKSKCVWSKCVLCIPYILSGNPNECWLHTCTCDRFVITTWRLGLWAPLVTRNYFAKFLSTWFLIWEIYNLSLMSVIGSTVPFKSIWLTLDSRSSRELRIESSQLLRLDSRFLRDSSNWNGLLFTIDYKGFCFECNLLSTLDTCCCENLTTLVQVLATF